MDSLSTTNIGIVSDTVTTIDTFAVRVIENTESLSYFLKSLSPYVGIIGAILGAILGYYFALRKEKVIEKKRLADVKLFFSHSIELLAKACKEQTNNIQEYSNQLRTEAMSLMSHSVQPNFHLKNIDSIKNDELFKIFITKSTTGKPSVELYDKFNVSIVLVRNVLDNFDKDIFSLQSDTNIHFDKLNLLMKELVKLLNSGIQRLNVHGTSDNETIFINYAREVFLDSLKLDFTNIFVQKKELVDKISEKARELNMLPFLEICADIDIEFKNFLTLRSDFNNVFNNYVSNLTLATENLNFIIVHITEV